MKRIILIALAITLVSFPATAADHGHGEMAGHDRGAKKADHGAHGSMGMKEEAFLVTTDIDGYGVSFHVMEAVGGMRHGGSHNVMVKIEREGKVVSGVAANSKVIHPDGAEETKPLTTMGDWMTAGYDLGHEGRHQLILLFKTADGKKHFGGVHYPH